MLWFLPCLLFLATFTAHDGSSDCDDFLVSGTQSLVTSDFPTEARLFNNKGWINETITVNLKTKSKIKRIAFQACDTNGPSTTLSFYISFRVSTGFAYYVDYYLNQMLYPVTSDCQGIKYVQFSAETTGVKFELFLPTTTKSYRIDLVGCPIDDVIGGNRSSWMTSPRLSNINITDKILWVRNIETLFHCSKECENDISCDSFIVSNDGKCQGHITGQTTTTLSTKVEPGLQFYIKNVDGYKIESNTGLLYKIYSKKREREAANLQCYNDGGHLIAMDSLDKIRIMWNIIKGNFILAQESHIIVSGYSDASGTWKFWNNVDIPDYMWSSGTIPDKDACIAMGSSGLEKIQCGPYYFICQKHLLIDQVFMG